MNIEVTTVSRQESTVGQSSAAIFVISKEDIHRSSATTIPELLRRVPGMAVARIDNNKWGISARGFNQRFGDKMLVQMDGRTLYSPLFSGVFWDTVDYPLEDIERIEVFRGPGASVWGANAVNGIINIITKTAKETQGGFLSVGTGSEEHGFGTLRYGSKNHNLFYRIYGKGFLRDKQFSQSGDSNDDWSGGSGGVRLDWQKSDRDSITIQSDYLKSIAKRKDLRPMITAPFIFTNIEDEVTDSGNVLTRWTRQLDNNSSLSLQVYWDRVARRGDRGFVDIRSDTFDADFQHELTIGHTQKIVYGIAYRYIDAFLGPSTDDNGFAVSFPPPDRNVHLFSLFLQDQITLIENELNLTLGSKFEHNHHTGFEIQPTIRILFTPTQQQTIWGAISRAVRTPNLSEEGIASRQLPSFLPSGSPIFPRLRGNLDFESENLLAYELGYRSQIADAFSIDVATFYNMYDDLRVVEPGRLVPGPASGLFDLPLIFKNRMEGKTYGVEVTITWQPKEMMRIYSAYSLLKINLRRDAGLPASVEISEEQSPQHQLYLQFSCNLPHDLEFDLTGRYVSELTGFTPKVKGYVSLDAHLNYRLTKNVEVVISGQNLLDNHHPEFGTAPLLRSLLVEIQRSVYAKVIWYF